jgi:hypothetical protein
MTAEADGVDGWMVFMVEMDFVTCMKKGVV